MAASWVLIVPVFRAQAFKSETAVINISAQMNVAGGFGTRRVCRFSCIVTWKSWKACLLLRAFILEAKALLAEPAIALGVLMSATGHERR